MLTSNRVQLQGLGFLCGVSFLPFTVPASSNSFWCFLRVPLYALYDDIKPCRIFTVKLAHVRMVGLDARSFNVLNRW